jgi:hypothetical protein
MMWRMLGADDPMEAHKIDSSAISKALTNNCSWGRTSETKLISFALSAEMIFPE